MKTKDFEPEFIATETLIVADIARSVAFYHDVLRATWRAAKKKISKGG